MDLSFVLTHKLLPKRLNLEETAPSPHSSVCEDDHKANLHKTLILTLIWSKKKAEQHHANGTNGRERPRVHASHDAAECGAMKCSHRVMGRLYTQHNIIYNCDCVCAVLPFFHSPPSLSHFSRVAWLSVQINASEQRRWVPGQSTPDCKCWRKATKINFMPHSPFLI